ENDDPGRWERAADESKRILLRGSRLVPTHPQGRRYLRKTRALRNANVPITNGGRPQNNQALRQLPLAGDRQPSQDAFQWTRVGRPIRVKVHGSVLHAILCGEGCGMLRLSCRGDWRPLPVLHAM